MVHVSVGSAAAIVYDLFFKISGSIFFMTNTFHLHFVLVQAQQKKLKPKFTYQNGRMPNKHKSPIKHAQTH
jgi:hypothetical protein